MYTIRVFHLQQTHQRCSIYNWYQDSIKNRGDSNETQNSESFKVLPNIQLKIWIFGVENHYYFHYQLAVIESWPAVAPTIYVFMCAHMTLSRMIEASKENKNMCGRWVTSLSNWFFRLNLPYFHFYLLLLIRLFIYLIKAFLSFPSSCFDDDVESILCVSVRIHPLV